MDGTSPHVIEPKYPAAVDRYVNLGQFYDIAAAKASRAEIVLRSSACSSAYQRAYRALGAARQIADSAAVLVAEGLDGDKLLRTYNVGMLPISFVINRQGEVVERVADPTTLESSIRKVL